MARGIHDYDILSMADLGSVWSSLTRWPSLDFLPERARSSQRLLVVDNWWGFGLQAGEHLEW